MPTSKKQKAENRNGTNEKLTTAREARISPLVNSDSALASPIRAAQIKTLAIRMISLTFAWPTRVLVDNMRRHTQRSTGSDDLIVA